ncbi:hypothetical protein M3I54_39990 [Paraburkholderia sp. CNPSo 3274]|nr:hypothetical protein [Paraburkholderia sp. CNPSo 3274]MCP3713005.1 hypothetical protein [Paraburkholderia sp. CNPSo 3274]
MTFFAHTGTPEQIGKKLDKLGDERLVTFTLKGPRDRTQAFVKTIEQLVPVANDLIDARTDERRKQLVEALTPDVPMPSHILKEASMRKAAVEGVFEASEWLTAAHIAEIAELSGSNPSAQPNRWKHDRLIFAVDHKGKDYFPAYGLDPKKKYRPLDAMANVLRVFDDSKDGWELAFWFASVNSRLGGERPLDVLGKDPGAVVRAAEAEHAGVLHG